MSSIGNGVLDSGEKLLRTCLGLHEQAILEWQLPHLYYLALLSLLLR